MIDWCVYIEVEEGEPKGMAKCGHGFHKECIDEYMTEAPDLPDGSIGCPVCFAPLTL